MLTTDTIASLASRFAIPGRVTIDAGQGGLPRLKILSPLAEAEVYLHGAHLTSYKPAGRAEVMFLSGKSLFQSGKAIRGGVPICFPWFGPRANEPAAPAHGFARLESFELESAQSDPDGTVHLSLLLHANDKTRRWWGAEFALRHRITLGNKLSMSLEMTNLGTQPITFEQAQHTYLSVADIHRVKILGLENARYLSRIEPGNDHRQPERPITFSGETDRTYLDTTATCVLEDPVMGRQIRIEKSGSHSTVIWNPWIAKSAAMADFGDDEWPGMVCIETANIGPNAVQLAAGAQHVMSTAISVL